MCWHLYVVWYPASTNTVEVGDMQLKYVLNKPVLGRLGFCKSRSWCPFVPWNMTAEDNLNISFNFWHNFMHLFVNLYVSKILEKVRKNYLKSGHFQIVVCLFVLSILWRISVRYGQWTVLALFNKIEIWTKLCYISGYIDCTNKADHILELTGESCGYCFKHHTCEIRLTAECHK